MLSEDEAAEMREHCRKLREDRDALQPHERTSIGGPLEKLTDHPVILGFMNEFVAHAGLASENCYGFRFENSFLSWRELGSTNFRPHGGRGLLNVPGNSHEYHVRYDEVHAGLTRAVWELNPVEYRTGGTLFLSGSHKAAFRSPKSTENEDCPLWEPYECPAGSVLFFTEAITHTGATWTNEKNPRVAIFNCYNTIGQKWHKWEPHPDQLAAMPPKRQTLFRGVYCQDNLIAAD